MRSTPKFSTVALQSYSDAQISFIAQHEGEYPDYEGLDSIKADCAAELQALADPM